MDRRLQCHLPMSGTAMSLPRSVSMLASAAAFFALVAGAGCTAGSTSSHAGTNSGTGKPTGVNAECQSPGSNGIADYSFGGPCGVSGPTMPGSVQVSAHVLLDPYRQLSFKIADTSGQVYSQYDQCSCAPEAPTKTGPSYSSYQPCDPSMDTSNATVTACTTTFENNVTGTVNATSDGIITLQLTDGTSVLEEFSFEVASPASIDVKATSGAAGSPVLTPDASGVYPLRLSDATVVLAPHLLTADGRALVTGGGRASLIATFSDSRVLASDPMVSAGQVGFRLAGAGDATVTISDGAKLTRVLKFHVAP